jgi:hypothetical protein
MSTLLRRSAVFAALALPLSLGAMLGPNSAKASFGFLPGAEGFVVSAVSEGASPALLAGSHPWEMKTAVGFELEQGTAQPGGPYTDGDLRDLHIELPPGLVENPSAIATCSLTSFNTPRVSPFEASRSGESCPDKSQIGTVTIHSSEAGGETRTFGVFNLSAPPGVPSQLGFNAYGVPIALAPHIRQAEGEYDLTLDLRDLSQRFDLYGFELTLWGVPWASSHNIQRGNCLNEADPEDPWGKCSVGRPAFNPAEAYLSLPPSCSGPLTTTAIADSWQHPGAYLPSGEPNLADSNWKTAVSTSAQGLQGCDILHFDPEVSGKLTTARAASPSGYALEFEVRDEGLTNPKLAAPTEPKKAIVTLPEGMTLNPSVAAGLGVCNPAQYAAETISSSPGAGCPNDSKIGDFIVQTPLFDESLSGGIFLAKPFENPFGSLLALYIVAKAPKRGVIVKVPGDVALDPASGQLTATFDDLPQLPYSHFRVLFREGQRSPLLSPPSCGSYSTRIDLHPWLDPETSLEKTSPFSIDAGLEGGTCPGGAAPPFTPSATGGTLNAQAGAYTPFYLHLARNDSEQEITSYSAKLPPGLLGDISGIPYCPDGAIEAAARETGVGEEEHPSCPPASRIGHTSSGYGVGPVLAYAPGSLYLAGPYHGSAFSVVAIDSATVGPFDLGTIVIRSAIDVDPRTAQVSIDSAASDPIPHIIDGIPLHLRDVRVSLDRQHMMINPTSCDPFTVGSTLTGSSAPFANPREIEATPTVRFQVSNCSSLDFRPRFALRLSGGIRRGQYPELRAVYTPRPGDGNAAVAAVTLPPTLFLAQNHIRSPCRQPELKSESCPADSVYGHATAVTPLLSEALRGPVYLASAPENASGLPDIVADLHGQGIRIVLDGKIDSSHRGIRATFSGLPDAPVTRFAMTIFGGRKRGILQAEDLCASAQPAIARFTAQDNTGEALRPRVSVRCPRHRRKKNSHHRGGKR